MITKKWLPDGELWRTGLKGDKVKVKIHYLKCARECFDDIVARKKTAEFRRYDRAYAVDDILVLYKLNTRGDVEEYSPCHAVEITHKQTGFGIPSDYVMLSVATFNLDRSKLPTLGEYIQAKPVGICSSLCDACNQNPCEC